MPSTYSEALRIELIAAGEQAGTWNITTNRNLGEIIEQAITGVETINVTSGDRTLLALNAAVDEARNAVLVITGLPEDKVTLTAPGLTKSTRSETLQIRSSRFNPRATGTLMTAPRTLRITCTYVVLMGLFLG